jgi:hypothetical protein
MKDGDSSYPIYQGDSWNDHSDHSCLGDPHPAHS